MLKKLFQSTLCFCLGLAAKAANTDVSKYENIVFPVSTNGSAGSTVTISVEMNNTVNVTAFQFNLVLPDGITVPKDDYGDYLIELSETRTTLRRHTLSSALQEDGSIKVLCGSQQNNTFNGSSGEVCTITLNIGDEVADDNYPIIFNDMRMSDASANVYKVEQVEATLTVGVSTNYDEGYSVRILPFLVTEEAEGGENTFLITNATALTNVEFDVVLPSDFITNELYGVDAVLRSTRFSTSFDEVNGTTIHVSVSRKSSYTIPDSEDSELAILGITYNDIITSGAHSITIKNIVLTDTDGTEYHAAPFTTYLIQDEYSRTMSNQWGTICLPYATQTTDDVQLYELSSVDMTAGIMKFSPVESLSANTPAIFKTTAANATFPVSEADEAADYVVSASTQADGWTAKGSFYDQELDPAANESDIYYISGGKFYYANQAFAVGTFRAWFETTKSAGSMAPSFSIGLEEEAADLKFVEKADGTVDVIYNLSGNRLQQKENGINIITGKKLMTR